MSDKHIKSMDILGKAYADAKVAAERKRCAEIVRSVFMYALSENPEISLTEFSGLIVSKIEGDHE